MRASRAVNSDPAAKESRAMPQTVHLVDCRNLIVIEVSLRGSGFVDSIRSTCEIQFWMFSAVKNLDGPQLRGQRDLSAASCVRVIVEIQFTSHVLPPSSEDDCS